MTNHLDFSPFVLCTCGFVLFCNRWRSYETFEELLVRTLSYGSYFFFPLGVIGFRDSRNFARGHDLANPFAYAVVGLQWGTKVGSIHQMGELCSQIVSRLKFLDTCQMERNYIIECCPKTDRKLLYGIWADGFIFVSQSGDKKAKFRVCEILYRFLRGNPQCRAPKLKHDLNNNNINNF